MSAKMMNRLFPFGVALIALLMGLGAVWPGGLFLTKYEGDTLHLMQILARMEAGQTPHIDFSTPIGAMAFWPMVALISWAGLGFGAAFIWSQVLVAAVVGLTMIYAGLPAQTRAASFGPSRRFDPDPVAGAW